MVKRSWLVLDNMNKITLMTEGKASIQQRRYDIRINIYIISSQEILF
jgi:hypothetical protein